MSAIIISPAILLFTILFSCVASDCDSCYTHQYIIRQSEQKFEQKSKRFWEFDEQSNSWVELKLPYDLVSCVDGNCTVVSSIQEEDVGGGGGGAEERSSSHAAEEEAVAASFGVRKRISLTLMSETSVWVTGESGSIYERFWNGLQWVIAPHDLPLSAGYAVSVFMVNQTILALSQQGLLYQVLLIFVCLDLIIDDDDV